MTNSEELIETAHTWLSEGLASLDGQAFLASPYLSYDICREVSEAARGSQHSFVLLTTLDPSAVANGYLSVQGLRLLANAGVEVRHTERLHAKCFLLGSRGVIGSANLTGAGLGSSASPNKELGVSLTREQARAARELITECPAKRVGTTDFESLLENAKRMGQQAGLQQDPLDAGSALQLAERLLVDARGGSRSLWLKLEYGEPALEGWRHRSWFASPKKGKPSFRPGDLVFVCAKDTGDCYAVVEVANEPEYQPQFYIDWTTENNPEATSRWPWVNVTEPRLVPETLLELKRAELGVSGQALQNGHVRLKFDQFSAGVRALARLATD